MTDRFTAKVKVNGKTDLHAETPYVQVTFEPDYAQGRNADWALATPSMSLGMSVKRELADSLNRGDTFTLTFEREVS